MKLKGTRQFCQGICFISNIYYLLVMRILRVVKFNYVPSGPLDEIKKGVAGKSWWEWFKCQCKIGAKITAEGTKQAKKDIKYLYQNLRNQLSPEQQKKAYEIKCNLWKLPLVGFLIWLGGPPLALIFKKKYPILTPTWYLRDTYNLQFQAQRKARQKIALNYFLACGSITHLPEPNQGKLTTTINMRVFEQMSLEEKKKVAELCFGETFDGTSIIREVVNVKFNYLVSPAVSCYLLQENMDMRLKGEKHYSDEDLDTLSHKVLYEAEALLKEDPSCGN